MVSIHFDVVSLLFSVTTVSCLTILIAVNSLF